MVLLNIVFDPLESRFMAKHWDSFQMMFAARNLNESKNQMLLNIDELKLSINTKENSPFDSFYWSK
jgi:hypothetical protein